MATTKTTRGKSAATERADKEDAIRKEYRSAGELDGMVGAWVLAVKVREHYDGLVKSGHVDSNGEPWAEAKYARAGARVVELAIARQIRRLWPKAGMAELHARGWVPAGSRDDDA
jgi:hypothetical protein